MEKRNSICFFNTVSIWGGGEKWHLEMAVYLKEKGYNVVMMLHPDGELLRRAIAIKITVVPIKLANSSFLNPFMVKQVKHLFLDYAVDRVIFNLPRDMKCGGLAAYQAKVREIIYRRGSAVPIRNDFINNYLFRKVLTKILANSPATKASLLENNPKLVPHNKITVIPNGIELALFQGEREMTYYKKQKEEIVLCSLGRLERQKNHVFLIEVAKNLENRGLPFTIIIGGEGALKESLLESIEENNLTGKVQLLGFIEHPKDFYLNGDIFVFPSLWEGFGYALAEASLCGMPIVAFDTSSNSQVVQNSATGFLTPTHDVIAFCDAIEILYQDPDKRFQMGQAGKEFIEDNFNHNRIFKQLENYLLS